MPLARDVSNAAGYGAVALALWYGYSMASNFYHFVNPEMCKYDGDPTLCVNPIVTEDQAYKVELHLTNELPIKGPLGKPIFKIGHKKKDRYYAAKDTRFAVVDVPIKKYRLHRNTTLFAVAIAELIGGPAAKQKLWTAAPLTHYGFPEAKKSGLFDGVAESDEPQYSTDHTVLHWNGNLSLHLVNDPTVYPKRGMPGDVRPFYQIHDKGYLPAIYIEQLSVLHKNSMPLHTITPDQESVQLNITVSPISLGRWRIYQQLERSLEGTKVQWGFGEPEIDQIKQLFCYTNHVLLAATFTVSLLHTLFSFLAMKNDIMYWRKRDSMMGLSASQIVFECFASYIIFLYLLDSDKGNKIVNFLCACECAIATWKLWKMMKMRAEDEKKSTDESSEESMTSEYDWLAIKYLGAGIMPFIIGYCVYSLLYEPHKSLYSWLITSLASVVYAIGFILMTPQLFINYKLKSVAHLPWRTLTYKAFNTFVDDLFSLVIDMPFLHRLACFRDDIVFFIFLYQWWLYGADKKRSYELDEDEDEDDEDGETAEIEMTPMKMDKLSTQNGGLKKNGKKGKKDPNTPSSAGLRRRSNDKSSSPKTPATEHKKRGKGKKGGGKQKKR
mmetsp:Transcript_19594/g.37931  ORF Transcript_19594/g.37931 Transcript_19594/m.37931 type:complete len:610 (-) Transcript_19594:136-1965(-)